MLLANGRDDTDGTTGPQKRHIDSISKQFLSSSANKNTHIINGIGRDMGFEVTE